MWWTCMKARKYWTKIHTWLENMKPETFLLGMIQGNYSKGNTYLVLHILTAARIAYAQCWKNPEIPADNIIIKKILECAEMYKLTLKIKGKEVLDYFITWELFYKWLNDKY
uniref:Uncharacterized protein n=1 Tax=Micrurus surinamensis TaxID=129470 RepID=A0A2D4PVR6_MICSU